MPNQISTWLSQLPWVGVKTKRTRGCLSSHAAAASPVRVLMLSVMMTIGPASVPHDVIEEAENHRCRAVGRHPEQYAAVADVESRKNVARAPALILEFEANRSAASHRPSSSRTAKRLNPGLLVHAQHGRAGGWRDVQLADLGRFRIEIRVARIEPVANTISNRLRGFLLSVTRCSVTLPARGGRP